MFIRKMSHTLVKNKLKGTQDRNEYSLERQKPVYQAALVGSELMGWWCGHGASSRQGFLVFASSPSPPIFFNTIACLTFCDVPFAFSAFFPSPVSFNLMHFPRCPQVFFSEFCLLRMLLSTNFSNILFPTTFQDH